MYTNRMVNHDGASLVRSLGRRLDSLEETVGVGENNNFIIDTVRELETQLNAIYRAGCDYSMNFLELLSVWYEHKWDNEDEEVSLHARVVAVKYKEIKQLIQALQALNATFEDVLLSRKPLISSATQGQKMVETTMLPQLEGLFKKCDGLLTRSMLLLNHFYSFNRKVNIRMHDYDQRLHVAANQIMELQQEKHKNIP
ncbi:hypothetical protein TPHA_0F00160 [Tetrapisispora phaffii CBS 4417]|uniref:Uncharacterized protein n=1 Tax=Tetrapisispora phaffii (strain ATCC 24235 / CBS 4417 / NBRC 1672 / NRRL Y-8282 / UCD 70-5) TaxID=1071381 RepID=G8BUS1_TETPH|nr:hypothetical protein TPHA_0F00160 [Tetrapisispora phaffii CBS 4417]CCE63503.1 hypothetical protein TPHA_0F00160 [Tetrapisispora phaffii CBS 4417]